MIELRITLRKVVESIEQGQALYNELKQLIAPKEPIQKEARTVDNHELE